MATNLFQKSFAGCLAVLVSKKVSNDVDKYVPSYDIFKDGLEPDVHDMTPQILSILIDFTQDHAAIFCTIFRSFFKTLNPNNPRTRRDIEKQKTETLLIFKGLSDSTIKILTSLAL